MDNNTILLVEDNSDDIELTLRAFRKNNIFNKVIVARDGVEALNYILARGAYADRDPHETPAVILLDLKIPKIDGLEVLRRIRAEPSVRFTPVVVLTSSCEDRDRISSYQLGANSFVQKPVDFDRFTQAAHQLGRYWLVLNEPPPRSSDVSASMA